jgi:GT2 family glycosyltransferase
MPDAALTLAAVVVTYNRRDQVAETVARLLDGPLDHLVVVDNGSVDGTREMLAGWQDPRLVLLRPDSNLGGAGGFELGLRVAVERFDPDWIVLMDDDARPLPGAIAAFRAMDRTGWDAVAAAVRYPGGQICEMNRPSVNPFWNPMALLRTAAGGGRRGFHLPDTAFDAPGPVPVDAASFVGLFLSRRAIRTAGFPDGRLFIYGDDVLYTLGLRRAGLRLCLNPAIRWEHDCLTLDAGGRRVYRPLWKVYYNYRNGLMAYRAASGPMFWLVLLVVLPKWFGLGRHYHTHAGTYRSLLRLAIRDGLARRLDRPHGDIVARAAEAGPAE